MESSRNVSRRVRGEVRGSGVRAARVPEKDPAHGKARAGGGTTPIRPDDRAPKVESFLSVWDAIAGSPAEAANLAARAELMRSIEGIVRRKAITQAEAARQAGVTQPRMNDLLRGRVSRFSLDALVGIADALGYRAHVHLTLRRPKPSPGLDEDEGMALALEEVRAVRKARRPRRPA